MNRSFRPTRLTVALVALIAAGVGHAQEKKPADPAKLSVMQRKLAHAQRALEGLAVGDFDKLGSGADDLILCAQEASWKVLKTAKYEVYSNDFLRQLGSLKAAAKAKNTDAAALAYVEVTLTCVKCHQHVREERVGLAPGLPRLRAGTE